MDSCSQMLEISHLALVEYRGKRKGGQEGFLKKIMSGFLPVG